MNRMNGTGIDVYYIAPCGRRLVNHNAMIMVVCVRTYVVDSCNLFHVACIQRSLDEVQLFCKYIPYVAPVPPQLLAFKLIHSLLITLEIKLMFLLHSGCCGQLHQYQHVHL